VFVPRRKSRIDSRRALFLDRGGAGGQSQGEGRAFAGAAFGAEAAFVGFDDLSTDR